MMISSLTQQCNFLFTISKIKYEYALKNEIWEFFYLVAAFDASNDCKQLKSDSSNAAELDTPPPIGIEVIMIASNGFLTPLNKDNRY